MRCKREIRTFSEEQTTRLGEAIGRHLKPGDMVFLTGELGAGKTRLAKGIVSASTGVPHDEVVSPTFTLVNRFEGPFPVHHADLYRLQGDQIEGIGLDDALDEGGALVVEWGERVAQPDSAVLTVTIVPVGVTEERRIVLEFQDAETWAQRVESIFTEWCGSAATESGCD